MWSLSLSRRKALSVPLLLGIVCLSGLAACGKKTASNAPGGQVIAVVGTDNVTIQELENEFRLANIPADKRDDATVKKVLTELVLRKYLVQQAIAAKLDREPTVLLDLLRTREQTLASAILQRNLAASFGSVGKADLDKYIAAHPAHFAGRKIFNVEQITFPLPPDPKSLVEETKDFKSLDQVDQKLTAAAIPHARAPGMLDSENLPDRFSAALQSKTGDELFFVNTGPNGIYFKVTGEQARPLTGDQALNRARQLLRSEMLATEGKQAAQAADSMSRYDGDYSRIMGKQEPEADKAPAK